MTNTKIELTEYDIIKSSKNYSSKVFLHKNITK